MSMSDLQMLLLTLRIGLVATAINLPLALVISWLLVKKRVPGSIVIDMLVSLPLAVPPVTIGFVLLLVLGPHGTLGSLFGANIIFTWVAATIASAIVSFPLVVRAIMMAMADVDKRLEMSARSLGAGPFKVIFSVTIPLAYRGILAGMLLGFVRALSEFGATITVAGNIPGKTQTLPLAIYSSIQVREDDRALVLAGISLALGVATLLVHNWLVQRTAHGTK